MSKIDEFIKREKKKLGWLYGSFSIDPTEAFSNPLYDNKIPEESIIKQESVWKQLIPFFIILTILGYFKIYSRGHTEIFLAVLAVQFSVIALFAILSKMNTAENEATLIKLNKDFIQINKIQISWVDIQETYIMAYVNNIGRKGVIAYLIIYKTDNIIRKIDINYLNISPENLANLIEHYKHLSE